MQNGNEEKRRERERGEGDEKKIGSREERGKEDFGVYDYRNCTEPDVNKKKTTTKGQWTVTHFLFFLSLSLTTLTDPPLPLHIL